MAAHTEQMDQKVREHQEHLARCEHLRSHFADAWELLNAPGELIDHAAEGFPPEDIEDLKQFLRALRTLYTMVANGSIARFFEHPDGQVRYYTAERELGELLEKHHYVFRPAFNFEDFRLRRAWHPARQAMDQFEHAQRDLFHSFEHRVSELLDNLSDTTESDLYVCRYCGRIGPAKLQRKRFCNDKCRKYHRRHGPSPSAPAYT